MSEHLGLALVALVVTALLLAVPLVLTGYAAFAPAILAGLSAIPAVILSVVPALTTVLHPCGFRHLERTWKAMRINHHPNGISANSLRLQTVQAEKALDKSL